MVASPVATPVTTPVLLTVATAVSELDHENGTLPIGALAMSKAAALNENVPPMEIVALAGATVTLATSAGGCVSPLSLHAPNVWTAGPLQIPAASRASDMPSGSAPASKTPTSTDVVPFAGPPTAAKTPSYDRNSTIAS